MIINLEEVIKIDILARSGGFIEICLVVPVVEFLILFYYWFMDGLARYFVGCCTLELVKSRGGQIHGCFR